MPDDPSPPTPPGADILLVDDRPANLLALEAVLSDLGVQLVRASSGEEALRLLADRDFAVVLLDVHMPGLSGFETARRMRTSDRTRHTPIIFLSAAESDEFPVVEAYRLGAVDFLFKPLVPDVLRAKVAVFVELFRRGERVRELERREGEDRLRVALDAGQTGVWEWDIVTGRIIWSDRVAGFYGMAPGEFDGTFEMFARHLHPDDAELAHEAIRACVERDIPYRIEYRIIRKDGDVRWINSSGHVVRDAAGDPVQMIGATRDVTDRKRSEAALRQSEEEFRATFEGAGVGKAQADPETGRLVRVNPKLCELLGYPADELLGMTIRELTHPNDRADGEARFRALVAGDVDQYAVEKRYLRKGGEAVWVRVTATVVRTPDGRPVRASAIIEDVTARIQAEAALRDADRKKDDFIALLAHELRNPLAPVRNGLQVLRLSPDQASRERALAMMDRQLGHMVRLIDDLLDVSRITRNKMELRRGRVTLTDVIVSAVETARPAIDAAGHELTVELLGEPVYLHADLTRLAQVFGNLLSNSVKYTPPGGRIRLASKTDDVEVVVTVSDTGIGIPSDSLPHIFDMFSQVDRSIERNTGGLGIGLALVKGLVEIHGGTVTAESEGKGSTFTVRLPLAEGKTKSRPEIAPVQEHGCRRVLVVDDNRDGADSLAMMLGLLGDEVRTAHDGVDAIEAAEQFRPEVILMDVGMPRLDGHEATRRIREQPWGKDITIVALTGWGQEGDRAKSREAGCDGHLVKPVSLADLQKLLAELA